MDRRSFLKTGAAAAALNWQRVFSAADWRG